MRSIVRLSIVLFVGFVTPAFAQPQTALSLKEMIDLFGKQPENLYLHRRIVEEFARANVKLTIPPEAVDAFKQGSEKLLNSPNQQLKEAAIDDFKQAVRLAPWWAEANFNLGYAYERSEKWAKAETMYGFYLLSGPTPVDSDKTRKRISDLEQKEEALRAEVDSGSVTAETFLDALDGAVYDCGRDERYLFRTAIRGRSLVHEPVEHTPPKAVGGLMPAGLALPRAQRRHGVTFDEDGAITTVWPREIVKQYQGTTRRCPRIKPFSSSAL